MINWQKMFEFKYIWILCVLTYLISIFSFVLTDSSRKLTPELNPGCNSSQTTCGKLIVITAKGDKDVLYYLWDFGGKPTFLMAEAPLNTTLNINWDQFTKYGANSINFSTPPTYTFGIIINKFYEFNDLDDTAILKQTNNETIALDTKHFNWTISSLLDDIPSNCVMYDVEADGYHDNHTSKSGTLKITPYAYGSSGHSENLPHLLHTENSSQIDLVIDHLATSFSNSRYAVEFITFSSSSNDSKVKLFARKTLDDENTPGVFTLDTLLVEERKNHAKSGYMQWRPIVYTSLNKATTNSTKTLEYDVVNVNNTSQILNSSLLYAVYGADISELFYKAENVSFGSIQDGFYAKTNYSSWSFLVGVGSPPEQPFSMLVFLIICIGLGLPTLIILGGTAFIIFRKIRNRD